FVLRDKLTAVLLILSAITPTVVFGAISVRAGWFFLPSTLVLKKNIALARFILSANMSGILEALTEMLRTFLAQAVVACSITFLLATLLRISLSLHKEQTEEPILKSSALVVLIAGCLHLLLASVAGQAYRYEAYLIALELLVLVQAICRPGVLVPQLHTRVYQIALLAFLTPRILGSSAALVISATNINEQQGALARFISEYYPNAQVGLNDIGVVSFTTSAKIVDLFGLAQRDIAWAKYAGTYGPETLSLATSNTQFAVVFDSWFGNGQLLPATWVKVAEWEHECNFVCTDPRLSFYAIHEDAGKLGNALLQFETKLSPHTQATYLIP
ncbi:MAG: hypothetical protein K1X79_14355, partial [Oligoflexia bacterium]|nr:hypothetical protein [Oligoflexia bacterium]